MNWNEIQGEWHLFKGKIKEKWGELTDDDIAQVNGEFEQFVGLLQKKLCIDRNVAEFQVREFQKAAGVPLDGSRESFIGRVEVGLPDTGAKLSELKDKAADAAGETKVKLNAEVAVLSERYEESKAKLAEIKASTGDAWHDLADGCSESWQDWKTSCESAWSRLGE